MTTGIRVTAMRVAATAATGVMRALVRKRGSFLTV
jgi:hypothetical protein